MFKCGKYVKARKDQEHVSEHLVDILVVADFTLSDAQLVDLLKVEPEFRARTDEVSSRKAVSPVIAR